MNNVSTDNISKVLELAGDNPIAITIGTVGVLLLGAFAIHKCKYVSVSKDGHLVMNKEDEKASSSHLKQIESKENVISAASGSNPQSSITNAKSEGSVESYAIDKTMSKESIEAMSVLMGRTQKTQRRRKS